tara:strand:+ start:905 stop:1411 length:507 start_codon:yes stop_codon:yes gene_type:complete
MSSFNFKSAGFKITDRVINNTEEDIRIQPIGIKTPLEFSKKSSKQLFEMNENPAIQISDNLKNLILTEKGERLGLPDYGCGIRNYLFDLASLPDYESVIISAINDQVEKYMPYLTIKNIKILDYAKSLDENNLQDRNGMAAILLNILYDVQKISIINQKLEVVIFSGG